MIVATQVVLCDGFPSLDSKDRSCRNSGECRRAPPSIILEQPSILPDDHVHLIQMSAESWLARVLHLSVPRIVNIGVCTSCMSG